VADNGIWFKLWVSSLSDPDLGNLSNAEFGCWCKLGAYLKQHGNSGELEFKAPATALQNLFQTTTIKETIAVINHFPNCEITTVSSETNAIVSCKLKWQNWLKYQGDFSTYRVKKFRAKKAQSETLKKRREEKREEEKRREKKESKNTFTKPTLEEIIFYCKERKNNVNPEKWLAHYESNGWLVGKNKMKDWKAAVRTWEDNNSSDKPQTTNHGQDMLKVMREYNAKKP